MTDRTDASSIAYAGLDEAGSLTAGTPFFTMAVVVVAAPDSLRNLIKRAAMRSGKRLRRKAKAASEIKWSNASQRLRAQLLDDLTGTHIEVFALTVLKAGRQIDDTPTNYGILVCELMSLCSPAYPNIALSLDRHFTSPAQIATVNTLIYRHWPEHGVLSIAHVDSQGSSIVQSADIVAGSIYSWHKSGDRSVQKIENKIGASLVEDWRHIKVKWLEHE